MRELTMSEIGFVGGGAHDEHLGRGVDVAAGQLGIIDGAHHYANHENVNCRTHAQCDQNGSWNVFTRLNDLFSRIGNKFESDIGGIDEGHRRHEGAPSHRR